MFYCESCRVDRQWPESFGKSLGPCEVCGTRSVCNNRPASTLPDPVRTQSIIDDTSYWW